MNYLKTTLLAASASMLLAVTFGLAIAANPMVGGAAMYQDKNIVENAVNS
jgi:hypothetical protein